MIAHNWRHQVSYSQADSLAQLIANLERYQIPYHLLEKLCDIDQAADLKRLKLTLSQLPSLLPKQQAMLDWLKEN